MLGLISKRRVAREIARVYNMKEDDYRNAVGKDNAADVFLRCCEAQSALNFLCIMLDIKPMHLNKLGHGTGEMLYDDWKKKQRGEADV